MSLAAAVELHTHHFDEQGLANASWAFAVVASSDAHLFRALAKEAEKRLGRLNVQELASMAWAFAVALEPAPGMLEPIPMLAAMQVQGLKPGLSNYHMAMESLVTTGQMVAGFALLEQVGASGLLTLETASDDSHVACSMSRGWRS
eukprot:gnl/TRDRNA2_/TRDRNA2_153285_c1_seq1.p2 gnl/TRDRNA2_/TRDRNA2_153285_c1~~gnl/TRDRNA2_/TRDRNA2_153285_c1_seq1.p2  ORF type:complete len:146 (+),score=25.75 gnl/TRDRNA2_/TRDRNA2_153285_c1_seq1:105-542(+)